MYSTTLHSSFPRVVLASGSPRRMELLSLLGLPFETLVTEADESYEEGLHPSEIVVTLAERKAKTAVEMLGTASHETIVIAADTVVAFKSDTSENFLILNKPANTSEATEMLRMLTGRTHQVFTGHTLLFNGHERGECFSEAIVTDVVFRDLSSQTIEKYIESGEPFDKAGGYGIQGGAAPFVLEIHGDYFNVMGLSVRWVGELLQKEGLWPGL